MKLGRQKINPASTMPLPKPEAPADLPALALALAEATETRETASARAAEADQKMAGLEVWQQYHKARQIAAALAPQIPGLPGFGEWQSATKAREAADQEFAAALKAWREAQT